VGDSLDQVDFKVSRKTLRMNDADSASTMRRLTSSVLICIESKPSSNQIIQLKLQYGQAVVIMDMVEWSSMVELFFINQRNQCRFLCELRSNRRARQLYNIQNRDRYGGGSEENLEQFSIHCIENRAKVEVKA
jgi:hypothetical protein